MALSERCTARRAVDCSPKGELCAAGLAADTRELGGFCTWAFGVGLMGTL